MLFPLSFVLTGPYRLTIFAWFSWYGFPVESEPIIPSGRRNLRHELVEHTPEIWISIRNHPGIQVRETLPCRRSQMQLTSRHAEIHDLCQCVVVLFPTTNLWARNLFLVLRISLLYAFTCGSYNLVTCIVTLPWIYVRQKPAITTLRHHAPWKLTICVPSPRLWITEKQTIFRIHRVRLHSVIDSDVTQPNCRG